MEKKAPLCPLCGVRERTWDGEPPLSRNWESNFFSYCYECFSLIGYWDHNHTYYGSPAQVKAGTVGAGHSWRTAILVHPIMEDGVHVGYRCQSFGECGWERRFTAAEMELCPVEHPGAFTLVKTPRYKVLCERDNWDHLMERGEIAGPHGYITDHGRQVEAQRSDAANWDPGKYVER